MKIFSVLIVAAALSSGGTSLGAQDAEWNPVLKDVWRSRGTPAAYAIVDGNAAILIGAPAGMNVEALRRQGVSHIDFALLTHHHRDTSRRAAELVGGGIAVRAAKESAPFLTPAGVEAFWQRALPFPKPGSPLQERMRTFVFWEFLAHPVGIEGIKCDLQDNDVIGWRTWTLTTVAAPGHSRDHTAFLARKGGDATASPTLLFAGDALAAPGKMWSPYTTDWDHWTAVGQKTAAASLRKLASLKPDIVLPEHGPPITIDAPRALAQTAETVEEVGFLKSFERYTKERIGNPPQYGFLSPTQRSDILFRPNRTKDPVRTWSRISDHLFVSMNTFAIASRDGALWIGDPYIDDIDDKLRSLTTEHKLGAVEIYTVSHAHYDHYAGIHRLASQTGFQVWTLDRIAAVVSNPYFFRAPFVETEPLKVDRPMRDGETVSWHEYRLRFRHFPTQTIFHQAIEVEIDGKRCLFTGDSFYHQDMYSGSGGWSGMNRGLPGGYTAMAAKVLAMKLDWILAEHGGAFEFNEEDWRRRVGWGQAAGAATDRLSPTGDNRRDWDPHRIHVEPLVLQPGASAAARAELVITNPAARAETLTLEVAGRGMVDNQKWEITTPAGGVSRRPFEVKIKDGQQLPPGRHVFTIRAAAGEVEDQSDAFFVIEVPARGS